MLTVLEQHTDWFKFWLGEQTTKNTLPSEGVPSEVYHQVAKEIQKQCELVVCNRIYLSLLFPHEGW